MKQKKFLRSVLFGLVLACMIVLYFGKKTDITQSPIKADLIVCLGGGYIERLNKGIKLYKKGFSDKIVLTGSLFGSFDSQDEIGFWKIPFFVKNGIHKKDIVFFEHMENTYTEIREIKAYMLKYGYKTVLIVSDPPHSSRIQYLIDLFKYKENNLTTKIIGSDVAWWDEDVNFNSLRSFWEVLKELIAMIYYRIHYGY